jgi:single-stranded DNA-binding protein
MFRSTLYRAFHPARQFFARTMCQETAETALTARREFYINKVQLLGRVVNDLRVFKTGENSTLAFTMVTRRHVTRNNKETGESFSFLSPEYTQVIVFSKVLQGVVQQIVRDGSRVLVNGRLKTTVRTLPDSETKLYRTSIICSSIVPVSDVGASEVPELRDYTASESGTEEWISFEDDSP